MPPWTTEPATPWAPGEGEVFVDAKQRAAAIVRELTTYAPGDDADAHLDAVAAGEVDVAELAPAAALHHDGAWSRGRVVYPQSGGFAIGADPATGIVPPSGPVDDTQTTSVMVVVEQAWGTDVTAEQPEATETRTIDVRLERDDGDAAWRLAGVPSVGGRPIAQEGEPHPALDDDRILLPDSARWDVAAGGIDPRLLDLLVDMADEVGPLAVAVLSSGHPPNVFGTDRLSSHTRGRAVDVYAVDGATVASTHALDSPTRRLAEWLFDNPDAGNFGGPWALDGFGGKSFTDRVHADHLHVTVPPSG